MSAKVNTKPMMAPTRFFLAFFSGVLLIRLGDFYSKEDAVDAPYGHDDGNRGPENGIQDLQYRLDD